MTPSLTQEDKREQQRESAQTGAAKQQPAPQPWTLHLRFEWDKPVEANWGKPSCDQPQTHEEADLCEQRRMAKAAEWAVGVGALTFIGLVFTIHFARKAANAAIEAARHGRIAAKASVDAAKAAATNIETLYKVERAYISGGGGADFGVLRSDGTFEPYSRYGEPDPSHFGINVNNYGKTPGELIEVYYGFIIGEEIPTIVPAFYSFFPYHDWIKPGTGDRTIRHVKITPDITYIFGRFYYRDIILGRKHSSGFILKIIGTAGGQPVSAPPDYSDERDEDGKDPPTIAPAT